MKNKSDLSSLLSPFCEAVVGAAGKPGRIVFPSVSRAVRAARFLVERADILHTLTR